jgi:hypothetical protein
MAGIPEIAPLSEREALELAVGFSRAAKPRNEKNFFIKRIPKLNELKRRIEFSPKINRSKLQPQPKGSLRLAIPIAPVLPTALQIEAAKILGYSQSELQQALRTQGRNTLVTVRGQAVILPTLPELAVRVDSARAKRTMAVMGILQKAAARHRAQTKQKPEFKKIGFEPRKFKTRLK